MPAAILKTFFVSIAAVVVVVIVAFLLGLLPNSPFQQFLSASEISGYLTAINYFIPLDNFVVIGEAWLFAVSPWIVAQFAVSGCKMLAEWIPFT